jgi:hypothetical protein
VAAFVLCVAGVVATVVMQGRALNKEVGHAQAQSRGVANEVDGALGTTELDRPIDDDLDAEVTTRLNHALDGQDFVAVRVWTPDGVLRHSTLARDRSVPVLDVLRESTKGTGHMVSVVDGDVLVTYVPLRDGKNGAPFGAVEVQQPYTPVLEAAATPWSSIRLLLLVLAGTMLFLFALGMLGMVPVRRSERAGAGFVGGPRADVEFDDAELVPETPGAELGPFKQPLPPLDADAPAPAVAVAPAPAADAPPAMPGAAEELDRVRQELKELNRRTGVRISELQDELDRTKEQLQEARKVAAPPQEEPSAVERARDLQEQLRAEHMRAGTAEARVKGLEAQLRLVEAKLAELSGPSDPFESEPTRAAG